MAANAEIDSFPAVEIKASSDAPDKYLTERVLLTRSTTSLDLEELKSLGHGQLSDLAFDVPGLQMQTPDGGLSTGFTLRGFAVTRVYYNGLPDVQRMFVRDLSTVDGVQVVRGASGVDGGIGSPGGSIGLTGKSPKPQAHAFVQLQAGNDAWRRVVADLNQPFFDNVSARLVLQKQGGRTNPGDLTLERDNVLASLSWLYHPEGRIWWEFEQQNNHQPYLFGTVITSGGVRYNQLYAAPQESSNRSTSRYATHWQDAWRFDENTRLNVRADVGRAHVLRDESLIGFWNQRSSTQLNGYFTQYHDDYHQNASHVNATLSSAWLGMKHTTRVGQESFEREFLFTGSQNIGGFRLNTAQPDFSSVDVSTLATTPRYQNTQLNEKSWYLQHTVHVHEMANVSAGMRHISYDTRSDKTRAGLAPTSQGDVFVHDAALVLWPHQNWQPYVSYAQGLEPNTGQTRTGAFLEPMRSEQYEMGLNLRRPDAPLTRAPLFHLAAYQVRLSGLAMTDPQDKTALVADGVRQVRGLEASTALEQGAWTIQSGLNAMRMHNVVRTSASQGEVFVGVPARTGTLGVSYGRPNTNGIPRYWVQWKVRSGIYADSANTVRLPGVALADIGVDSRVHNTRYALAVRNVTNKDHVSYVTALDDVYQGPKRQLRLTMTSEW